MAVSISSAVIIVSISNLALSSVLTGYHENYISIPTNVLMATVVLVIANVQNGFTVKNLQSSANVERLLMG